MPKSYDGKHIYRRNIIDYNAYNEFKKAQEKISDDSVREQNEKNREESWDQWMTWCPQDFRSASIESIGAHDPDVEKALNDAIAQSTPGNPSSVILGSREYDNPDYIRGSNDPKHALTLIPKGKTWAMYAYVSALYSHGIITDPVSEISMITEANLLDKLTSWKNDDWLKTVFTDRTRLVIIDNINGDAGMMKRQKYGLDAWDRFVEEAMKHNGIGYVFSFSGNFDDMSLLQIKKVCFKLLYGKKAVKAILEHGVEGAY